MRLRTGGPTPSVAAKLWDKAGDSLAQAAKEHKALADSLAKKGETPASEQVAGIVARVSQSIVPRTDQTVDGMQQSLQASIGRVRGELAERGVRVDLNAGLDRDFENVRRIMGGEVSGVVQEKLVEPTRNEQHSLVTQIREEIIGLADALASSQGNVQAELALNVVELRNSKRELLQSFEDWCKGLVAAVKVFAGIESRRDYFTGHSMGDSLAKEFDSGLANLQNKLLNDRRFLLAQSFGSSFLVVVIVLVLTSFRAGVIPLSADYSAIVNGVILAFLGVAATGLAHAVWRLASFRGKARLELVRTMEEQMATYCQHSRGNLSSEEAKEEQAYAAVRIALSYLVSRLEYNGVQAVVQQLLEQIRERLERFGGQCEQEEAQATKHIRASMDSFCKSCRQHLNQTGLDCAESLHATAQELMTEEVKKLVCMLEQQKSESVGMDLRLAETGKRQAGSTV